MISIDEEIRNYPQKAREHILYLQYNYWKSCKNIKTSDRYIEIVRQKIWECLFTMESFGILKDNIEVEEFFIQMTKYGDEEYERRKQNEKTE